MLHGGSDEPVAVGDGKLIHRLSPLLGRTSPVGRDVAQRQPDQLGGRVVTGEVPRVLMILRSRALMLSMALVV